MPAQCKGGVQLMQTRLNETFSLGLTDDTFNAFASTQDGDPQSLPNVTNPQQLRQSRICCQSGSSARAVPYDLTLVENSSSSTATEHQSVRRVFQDSIKFGESSTAGLRLDQYKVLPPYQVQPRIGFSYLIKEKHGVEGGLFPHLRDPLQRKPGSIKRDGDGWARRERIWSGKRSLQPGTGTVQCWSTAGIGKYLMVDADYFWKYTNGAYDFDTLFIRRFTFPIQWKIKLDGVSGTLRSINIHGFQWVTNHGTQRARYFDQRAAD